MSQTLERPIDSVHPGRDANEAELRDRLLEVHRLEGRRRWASHGCNLVLIVLGLAIGIALCDFSWPLAVTWRLTGLLVILVVAVWQIRRATHDSCYATQQAASDVEATFPRYGQRLRTTLDYADQPTDAAPASPSLLRALRSETRHLATYDDFTLASSPYGLYRRMAACLAVFVCCGVALLIVPELRVAAGRVLLLPLHYTTVSCLPIEQPIARGENAVVEVDVQGRPIREAIVQYRQADSLEAWQALPLTPPATENDESSPVVLVGKLSATIKDCENDLEVVVVAGPRDLPVQRITVLQPLELSGFSARIQPPEYTSRTVETVNSENFAVWEGSQVALRFEMNRPPSQVTLVPQRLAATNDEQADDDAIVPVPLAITDNIVTGQLSDVRQSMRFTLAAEAADGMSLDSPRYHIRVQLDKKPEIRFVRPDEQLEVIATTEVPLSVEAGDDLGVTNIGILYKIGTADPIALWEQAYSESQPSLHVGKTLSLEKHALTYHDAVTYYAFAEDNYFGQPRRITTELRFIDIRPFKREYQILQSPGGT